MQVFADTSFFQAWSTRSDQWHTSATQLAGRLDAAIVTTDYILLELGALMSRGRARSMFVDFVANARTDVNVEIIPASSELLNSGFALFAARPDKEWSLTDCISFVVMRRRGIQEALTSDHHFEQAGFRVLLNR